MAIKLEKIKPNCGNCRHSYHAADDPKEMEKCRLVGRFNQARINPDAKRYAEFTETADMCRFHEATERLKNLIDYSMSE